MPQVTKKGSAWRTENLNVDRKIWVCSVAFRVCCVWAWMCCVERVMLNMTMPYLGNARLSCAFFLILQDSDRYTSSTSMAGSLERVILVVRYYRYFWKTWIKHAGGAIQNIAELSGSVCQWLKCLNTSIIPPVFKPTALTPLIALS